MEANYEICIYSYLVSILLFKTGFYMNTKGIALPQNLIKVQQKKLTNQTVRLTSYYPFAITLPNDIDKGDESSVIEIWVCRSCGKDFTDNCDCNNDFDSYEIKIQNGS